MLWQCFSFKIIYLTMTKTKLLTSPHGFKKFRQIFGDTFTRRIVSSTSSSSYKLLKELRKKKSLIHYSFTTVL